MIIESDLQSFLDWLLHGSETEPGALLGFAITAAALALVALIIGFLAAAVRHGPMKAGDMTYRVVMTGIKELFVLSPRRVWALARLAFQESIRRRVLVSLVIFLLILLFAAWFLKRESPEPARLYLSFVLTATTYLVLLLALFLSAFSLPADFKSRTIYTVVTKPVRAGEIVLGRIIGFALVGTLLLAIMATCSYAFVKRTLHHTHPILPGEIQDVVGRDAEGGEQTVLGKAGRTGPSMGHRHAVVVERDGFAETLTDLRHRHPVTVREHNGKTEYETGAPEDLFQARVPIYGKLRFKDRSGQDVARGISVGNEWGYRSFIEGETLAAAIWSFSDIDRDEFPDGLPIELTLRVFRTYKGDIEKGILGSLLVMNPDTGLKSDIQTFRAKDFYIDEQFIPRALTDSAGNPLDLYKDLVTKDGRVDVQIQCRERSQYFGAAQADCYLRAEGGSFPFNFVKGYLSIWVQMVLVICLGVLFSTFLSGPVAMLATIGSIVVGFFADFVAGVVMGVQQIEGGLEGGGPVESLIRTVTQQNMTSPMDEGLTRTVAKTLDRVLSYLMDAAVAVLPNFSSYSNVSWVAYGFNIPGDEVLKNLVACVAYVFGAFVAGYFLLRMREVAK